MIAVATVAAGGGTTPRPTFGEVSAGRTGHAEAVQIAFDPRRISYRELLERVWESHDATRMRGNDRYRSAIFTHSPEQAAIARDLKEELERSAGRPLVTAVTPATRFYRAQDHHQRYLEKRGAVA